MSHNPYSPPTTPVADIEEARVRPRAVKVALVLYFGSLVFAAPEMIYNWRHLETGSESYHIARIAMVTGMVIMLALGTLLFTALWKGWRWGRIVYAGLVAVALIATYSTVPKSFALHWFFGAANLASSCSDMATVFLLFSAAGNAWFRKSRR